MFTRLLTRPFVFSAGLPAPLNRVVTPTAMPSLRRFAHVAARRKEIVLPCEKRGLRLRRTMLAFLLATLALTLPQASAGTDATALTGGSPTSIGCIACDGQSRFLAPGVPLMTKGSRYGATPEERQVAIPLPAGDLSHLRVKLSTNDQGKHIFAVRVNGNPTGLGCATFFVAASDSATVVNQYDHCVSNPDTKITIVAGDVVSLAVSDFGTTDAGDETVTFSIEFVPLTPVPPPPAPLQ